MRRWMSVSQAVDALNEFIAELPGVKCPIGRTPSALAEARDGDPDGSSKQVSAEVPGADRRAGPRRQLQRPGHGPGTGHHSGDK